MTSFQYRAIGSTRVNNIHHRSDIENPAQHSKERKNHASHAPFLTDEDQKSLRENDLFVSITPESEFHFGHGQTSGRQITDQTSLGVDTNWNFFFPATFSRRPVYGSSTFAQFNYHQTLETGKLPNLKSLPRRAGIRPSYPARRSVAPCAAMTSV